MYMKLDKVQSILDHFGVGTLKLIKRTETIPVLDVEVKFIYIETSKGNYLLIEFSRDLLNRSEIQKEVDNKLNLLNILYAYPKENKIEFAHVDGHYYSLRKV